MKDFDGKVAVITGGASGIGWGMAQRFSAEGMRIVLSDIDQTALDQATQKLRQQGRDAIGVHTDVADPRSVDELKTRALDAYGKVHLVCNNAGVLSPGGGPIWDASLNDWQWLFSVNVWGSINGARTFMPLLIEQGEEAHMIFTGSIASFGSTSSIYAITKHTVLSIAEAAYLGLQREGVAHVGASVICPTPVNTNFHEAERHRPPELRNDGEPANDASSDQLRHLLSKGISPEEMAEATIEGVREGRFYIFAPDYQEAAFNAWVDNLKNGRNPEPPIRHQ